MNDFLPRPPWQPDAVGAEHYGNPCQEQKRQYAKNGGTKELEEQHPVLLRVVFFLGRIVFISHGGKDFTAWLAA